ncbi:MAG: ABC transporter permease, partial [Gemmatimonadaceae bacterium]
MFADLRFRLRALFNRRAMEQELDEELAAHIERETEKYVRQGMPRTEALRRARLAFGGIDRIKDDTRDVRGTAMLETIAQDLRYAWRGLRSRPGFTGAVVVTLGLGIGANTAMFGIVDRLLFRPPAFLRDADRVHRVFAQYVWNGESRTDGSHSFLRFTELTTVPSLDGTVAYDQRHIDVGMRDDAQELTIATTSATLFDFFSVRPVLGRFFTPDEDKAPSGTQVVVLGHDFWRSKFAGSSDVLGKSLHVGAIPYTIIGVAPRGFTGFSEGEAPVAYVPITAFAYARTQDYPANHNWTWLLMYARRRPGV